MTKKILQISPYTFDHPGGVEQYARVLQDIFPDTMTTLSGGGEFPILEPVKNCPLPCFWRKNFWKTFDMIQKGNTSCIISHIRFAPTSWLAFFLAKKRGIPYIHIEHGTGYLIHKNVFIAWVAKMVDRTIGKYIIHHAYAVVCVSKAGKIWVQEAFGRKEKIFVIYRGFSFSKIERKTNTIKKIGFVGRLTGLKNVSGLIDALVEIREEKWVCEIVGDGEERGNLESQTERLGLSERIRFLGSQSHEWIIKEFFSTVDIFVNPSLQEGLPTTVIEALGMGCQVIATDVGGTREIRRDILIPANDIKILENKIRKKLLTPSDDIKLPENIFSYEKMHSEFLKIFSITLS